MRTDAFNFNLPDELIAQEPASQRDQARLMVIDRASGSIDHRQVRDLPDYLRAPDLLIVNDTRVIPARLLGHKASSGGQVELLLLEEHEPLIWDVLMRCSRRPKPGARMTFGDGALVAEMVSEGEQGRARVRFITDQPLLDVVESIGRPPLPPYIGRKELSPEQERADRERYQTVYAQAPGAVAAPTAGLHFTPALFDQLAAQGVQRAAVTLHVGLGTFRPVTVDDVEAHQMESERYSLSAETAQAYHQAREAGGRIVAVGSTSVRTLETVMQEVGHIEARSGRSAIYIYPPYTFGAVDVMMTNFHLPKSTLIMMVCAFAGYELTMEAYRVAVAERYRFYSYGDAMLIL